MRRGLFVQSVLALFFSFALSSCAGGSAPVASGEVIAVSVSPGNPVVLAGEPLAFEATAILISGENRDITEDPTVAWNSSNPSVATINADGTGTALAEGESFITATYQSLKSPAQKVTVNPAPTPTPTPTPAPTADHVVISEVMYDPATAEPGTEYIEIHNPTGASVTLDNWELVTRNGGSGSGVFTFSVGTDLAAGAFAVVARDETAFTDTYGSVANLYSPIGADLLNGGDTILLRNDGGLVVDEMAYEAGSNGRPAGWCDTSDPSGTSPATDNVSDSRGVSRKPVNSDGDTCNDWFSDTLPNPGVATP